MPGLIVAAVALAAVASVALPLVLRAPPAPDRRSGDRWCLHCRPREDCDECR